MYAYLLDCVCAFIKFMGMSWEKDSALPIYLVCRNIWLSKYNGFYFLICDFFWDPLYNIFHGKEYPRLIEEAKIVIRSTEDWYLLKDHTYLKIFGATTPPHLLPKHVPDRLVLVDILFQTMMVKFNSFLIKEVKKKSFIPYYFSIGYYGPINSSHAILEGNKMLEHIMPQRKIKNHDPLSLVSNHCVAAGIQWIYPHRKINVKWDRYSRGCRLLRIRL